MELSKYFEWLKLPPKYLCAISVVTGFLLFGSDSLIFKLGVDLFLKEYRIYIGIIFLFSAVLLIANLFEILYIFFKNKIKQKILLKNLSKRLKKLTIEEKNVLSEYINKKSRTQYFNVTDGIVLGLEKANIIYRASNISEMNTVFPYNLQLWAWDYLIEHPELLV